VLLLSVLVVSILTVGKPVPSGLVAKYAPQERLAQAGRESDKKSDDGAKRSQYADAIGLGFVGVGVGPAHKNPNPGGPSVLRMNYLLPFEIVSVHLLVVLIGAAYLARAKRRRMLGERGPVSAPRQEEA